MVQVQIRTPAMSAFWRPSPELPYTLLSSNQLIHTYVLVSSLIPSFTLLNCSMAISGHSNVIPCNCFLNDQEEAEVSGGEVWRIWDIGHKQNTFQSQKASCCTSSVRWSIYVMQHKSSKTFFWMVLAPSLEHLGQALVHVPIRHDCTSVLKEHSSHILGLAKMKQPPASLCFLFLWINGYWGVTLKHPTEDCCFVLESNW